MGARFLTDVVPIVPGWHVWTTGTGEKKITANGANAFRSGEIMIMINSHTINDGWTGGAGLQHHLLSIDNAKRIEFMSGRGFCCIWVRCIRRRHQHHHQGSGRCGRSRGQDHRWQLRHPASQYSFWQINQSTGDRSQSQSL